jgi:hypothetical protein
MKPDRYYIVNEYDRPCERMIARLENGRLYYLDPDLRAEFAGGFVPDGRETELSRFGLYLTTYRDNLVGLKIRSSMVTYQDGKIRHWQGKKSFSIKLPEVKNES